MGVVWSCYKYLTQANESRARHRSLDSDAASSPDDVQVHSVYSVCVCVCDGVIFPVILSSISCQQ